MKLEGEKIYLRPILKKHLPVFLRWFADHEVARHTLVIPPTTIEEELEWYEKMKADPDENGFSIYVKNTTKPIGNCGVHMNAKRKDKYKGKTFVGIIIGERKEWNKGYGTDVINTLLDYCKNVLGETDVYLSVDTLNKRAQRVYEKCGFEVIEKRHNPERTNSNDEEYIMKVKL